MSRALTVKKVITETKISLEYHDTLNPKLWDGWTLKPGIKNKLMEFAKAWADFSKIPFSIIKDVIIIGGNCNRLCNSCNSIIIGGTNLQIQDIDNTIFLNSTTNFRQTVEISGSDTVSASPFSIDFTDGAIKYINSVSTDFQVDFTNVPSIPDTPVSPLATNNAQ
jgi:hypothetical protein